MSKLSPLIDSLNGTHRAMLAIEGRGAKRAEVALRKTIELAHSLDRQTTTLKLELELFAQQNEEIVPPEASELMDLLAPEGDE
jgi:hypothetical protein